MKKYAWLLVWLIAVTACSATTPGKPGSDGSGTTAPVEPLPADQLVVSLEYSGGLMDVGDSFAISTAVGMYGDGRVYRLLDGDVRKPRGYELGQADPQVVAELAAKLDASGLIDKSVYYGMPQVTDGSSTTVTVHTTGEAKQVSVYMPSYTNGVPSTAADLRRKFVALVNDINKLVDQTALAPAPVDQIQVVQIEPYADTGIPWPGPDPATFLKPSTIGNRYVLGCGALSGPEAEAVLTAAADASNRHWDVGGTIMQLSIRPLLPGEQPCAD